jgi:hypothetical protein
MHESTTTTETDKKKLKPFEEIDADKILDSMSELQSLCIACEEQGSLPLLPAVCHPSFSFSSFAPLLLLPFLGTTRLLLTRIPYFRFECSLSASPLPSRLLILLSSPLLLFPLDCRDVVIMSFECPACGYRNNEVQPANELAEKGVSLLFLSLYSSLFSLPSSFFFCQIRFQLRVDPKDKDACKADLNRQIIKSEYATISVPEIQLEISVSRAGSASSSSSGCSFSHSFWFSPYNSPSRNAVRSTPLKASYETLLTI